MKKAKRKSRQRKSLSMKLRVKIRRLREMYLGADTLTDLRLFLWPTLMFALLLAFFIRPLRPEAIAVTMFDRVFGNATLAGIDADKRTMNLLLFNVLALPLCFLASFIVLRFIANIKKYAENPELIEWVDSVSICGTVITATLHIARYTIGNTWANSVLYAPVIVETFVIAGLIYSRRAVDSLSFEDFKFTAYLSFALSLLLNFMLQSNTAQSTLYNYRILFIFPVVNLALLAIFKKHKSLTERIRGASIPLLFGMLAIGFFLEFTNILNQHNIFIVNRIGWAKLVGIAIIALSLLLYLFKFKPIKNCVPLKTPAVYRGTRRAPAFWAHSSPLTIESLWFLEGLNWETAACIGIILGLVYFNFVPPLTIDAGVEIFEQANHGMLVYDTVHFGKIPLLESFDGHMLSGSLNGIVFNLLNDAHTIDGSYFFSYNIWGLIINIGLFLLLRQVFGNTFAFFAILCVPIPYIRFFVVPAAALLFAVKRQSFGAWLWYFITLFFAACYEFPTAAAIGGGTFATIIITYTAKTIQQRRFGKEFQAFVKAGTVFFSGFIVFYAVLCVVKGLNPISRARYFLGLVASNRNWAYASIGDAASHSFALIYSFVPAVAAALMIFTLYRFLSAKEPTENPGIYAISALILAYFFNYQRMLGRHSLAEGNNGVLFGLEFFFVSLLFIGAAFIPKLKRQIFISVALLFPFFFTAAFASTATLQNALASYNNNAIYYNGAQEKVQRVTYDNVRNTHASVINMINRVMEPDETYMDLSSQTMLYALTGKEKPAYINQSILHLSGEYTQEAFIAEIEKYGEKCAYALLGGWTGLDGIENPVKYYKVWEFLNKNFLPLCRESVDGYSLWVRKEKYAQVSTKLLSMSRIEEINIELSRMTDENWENGIMKNDNRIVLAQNAPDSFGKATILTVNGLTAIEVESIEMKGQYQWVRCANAESAQTLSNAETVSFQGEVMDFLLIDYSAYNHYYNVGYLPYLWGEYDRRKAYNNPVVCVLESVFATIPASEQSNENYILLNISAAQDDVGYLTFADEAGESGFGYTFNIKQGEHRYLFRVSGDNYWTTGELTLSYSADAGAQAIDVLLLEGD